MLIILIIKLHNINMVRTAKWDYLHETQSFSNSLSLVMPQISEPLKCCQF